jgi:hypothetical protein
MARMDTDGIWEAVVDSLKPGSRGGAEKAEGKHLKTGGFICGLRASARNLSETIRVYPCHPWLDLVWMGGPA